MDKISVFRLVVGGYLVITSVLSIIDGSTLGLGLFHQKDRYATFNETPIEFLIMICVKLCLGIWLLKKSQREDE